MKRLASALASLAVIAALSSSSAAPTPAPSRSETVAPDVQVPMCGRACILAGGACCGTLCC